jgi:DNA-binding NarL/FixJ family response regulator
LRIRLRENSEPAVRRVLAVETSRVSSTRFRRIAEQAGWVADLASDPTEAFGLCLSYRYEAILLQLAMKHGAELLEPLRELQRDAAFVLVQEAGQHLMSVPAPEAGIVGLVRKPWCELELRGVLERAASLSAARHRFEVPTNRDLRCAVRGLWVGDDASFEELRGDWKLDKIALTLLHARSLRQACERLATETFDLVLTELTLPDAWGLDAIAQLALHPAQPSVVVMTRVYDQALVSQLLRLGASAFVPLSPVDRPRLEAAVLCALTR